MEQPPFVLHVIGSLDPGGTEHQLIESIARSSAPERHRVAVFARAGELADRLAVPPVVLSATGRGRAPTALRAAVALRRLVRTMEPDVVHAHLAQAEVLCALAVPSHVPIVASRRGRTPLFETRVVGPIALGFTLRRTAALICNTDDLAKRARKAAQAPEIVVIRNGVDLERFRPTPFPDGPPTVVMVARLRPQKAHDRFLRAFDRVRQAVPGVRAVLVGDGPCRRDLEDLVTTLGITDRVLFTGGVADPRPFFASAHVVALTSPYEGLPNAVLEAMASGRPVVSTAVGGVLEMMVDGREGRLVPDDDVAIAQALIDILQDPAAAQRMGAAARETALMFDWPATVERTERLYRSVACPGAPAPMLEASG